MTKKEFDTAQDTRFKELFMETPIGRTEKDIWNLMYLRYSVKFGTLEFRKGFISTLDRAIANLKAEEKTEN